MKKKATKKASPTKGDPLLGGKVLALWRRLPSRYSAAYESGGGVS